MASGREDYLGRNIKCVGWKYPVNKHWVLLLAYTPFPAIWIWISEICDSQRKSLNIYGTCVYYGKKPSWFINRDYGILNIVPEKPEVKPSKMEKFMNMQQLLKVIIIPDLDMREQKIYNFLQMQDSLRQTFVVVGTRKENRDRRFFFLHSFWVINYELCFNR